MNIASRSNEQYYVGWPVGCCTNYNAAVFSDTINAITVTFFMVVVLTEPLFRPLSNLDHIPMSQLLF